MSSKDKSLNLKRILETSTEFHPENELTFQETIEGISQNIIDGDDENVRSLMRVLHRKIGAQKVASKMGIKRESLIRMTSSTGNPTLKNVVRFLKVAQELYEVESEKQSLDMKEAIL